MRGAGAIPFLRTNLPDLGLRVHTDSTLHGLTRNPWNQAVTAGGSSGGEASAIAAGMSPLGLGNDIGGSLRNPAHCCGITSIKPTVGVVPMATVIPPEDMMIAAQLMVVEGTMARHVAFTRDHGVRVKFNPVKAVLDGKRVVVVDDSIVRGTTSRKLVKMIRRAGAREIHFRISSPPIISPCFFGIDTPRRSELIGANHSIEEIGTYLRVDSIGYLSQAGMLASMRHAAGHCTACFDEQYPVPLSGLPTDRAMEPVAG